MPKIFTTNNDKFNEKYNSEYINLIDQTSDCRVQLVSIGQYSGSCLYAIVQSHDYFIVDRIGDAYNEYNKVVTGPTFNRKDLNLLYREQDFDDFGHASYITTVDCQMKGHELEMIYREFELNQTGRNATKLVWDLSLDKKYYVLFTDEPVSGYNIGVIRGFLYGLIYQLKRPVEYMNKKGCDCHCKEIREDANS